jgi:hypothetical protein
MPSARAAAHVARSSTPGHLETRHGRCTAADMFVFFSNKFGCLGSIVVSIVGTALVVGLIWLL